MTKNEIDPRHLERYIFLANLRDDEGASEGEKANAQGAIDRLCERIGATEEEMKEAAEAKGIVRDFYLGKEEPHMAEYKSALLQIVALGHGIQAMAYEGGMSFVLIGPKRYVNEAADLYRFIVEQVEVRAEEAFALRNVRFDEGDESAKPGWIHSFRQGVAFSLKDRLQARYMKALREEALLNGFSVAVEQERREEALREMLREIMDSVEMQEMVEEMRARQEIADAKKAESVRARMEELGIRFNPLGYAVGREVGKIIPLQAEVTA